jgi:hypothetical protein
MRLAPVVLVPALAGGCSLLVSTSGLVGEHHVDAGLVSDASASTDVVRSTSEASADGACGASRGPSMVHVTERVCIDSTEVTRGQYRAFLASV